MLKKISHILLAIVVMITTMGLTVSVHYCGDELKSVDLVSESDNCCGDSCPDCQNEIIEVDIEDDFTIETLNVNFTQLEIVLPILIELIKVEDPIKVKVYSLRNTIPPPKIQTILSSLQTYLL